MVPLLHLKESDSDIIKYILGELLRNMIEHSFSETGAIVSAKYYQKTNRISLAICDSGIGLRRSLNIWHPTSDTKAIELALLPGIAGTTHKEGGTADNAGAGLFFVKSMAKNSRSRFLIYSGTSAYTLLKTRTDQKTPTLNPNPFSDHHQLLENAPNWQGTLVAIDISLDETPEFREMLKKIGDVYESAIRERKKTLYRKPNFI